MSKSVYLLGGKVSFWKNPAAYFIRFGTDSEYWHVECELYGNYLIGALFWKGVVCRHINEIKSKLQKGQYLDEYECIEPLDDKAYEAFLMAARKHKYDKWGVLYLAWLKLRLKKDEANKFQKDRDYFCSELAAQAFRAGKAKLPQIPEGSITSPGHFKRADKSFIFIRRIEAKK